MRSFFTLLLLMLCVPTLPAQRRGMEWSDVMKFRRITGSALSPDGKWLAYAVMPDRGDGAAYVVEIASGRSV